MSTKPKGEALKKARRDPKVAARVMAETVPDPSIRAMLLDRYAAGIRAAHGINPNSWGLTLFGGAHQPLRLNVGQIETLVVQDNELVKVVVHRPTVREETQRQLDSSGMYVDWNAYNSEPEAALLGIPLDKIEEWLPRVLDGHLELIRVAARRVKTRTSYGRNHSPGVVDYLNGLDYKLPQPGYYKGTRPRKKTRRPRWRASALIGSDISEPPKRVKATVNRVVRNTKVVQGLKELYIDTCQLCNTRLQLSQEIHYSEGHHLRPLGAPHDGLDIADNLIVVCPNCHALLDFGAIDLVRAELNIDKQHPLADKFIRYHNKLARDRKAN